jgi:hypothetical protein
MKFIPFILLLVGASCSVETKEFPAPKDLISKDSMILILHDLSILESYIHQKHIQLERYALLLRKSGDSLLLNFGVDRERYERSMDYYGHHPKLFINIYDSVIYKLDGNKVTTNPYDAIDDRRHGF